MRNSREENARNREGVYNDWKKEGVGGKGVERRCEREETGSSRGRISRALHLSGGGGKVCVCERKDSVVELISRGQRYSCVRNSKGNQLGGRKCVVYNAYD